MSPEQSPAPPDGYKMIYKGTPLPPFYAAEMLRPLLGHTVWVCDVGGRVRNGELAELPRVREDQAACDQPATFTDERPLFLRQIVHIAVYERPQ